MGKLRLSAHQVHGATGDRPQEGIHVLPDLLGAKLPGRHRPCCTASQAEGCLLGGLGRAVCATESLPGLRAKSGADVLTLRNILSAGHVKGHGCLLSAGKLILRACEVGLRHARSLIDVVDASLLGWRKRSDKSLGSK